MKNYLLLIPFIFVGCAENNNPQNEHPTQENLSSNFTIEVSSVTPKNSISTKSTMETFGGLEKTISIGELYGSESEMFGYIEDLTYDSFGRLYLLDTRQQSVHVFNEEGEFINKLGGKGQGPGELERANSFVNYNNEKLVISNGNRLELFDISEKEIAFIETKEIGLWSHSLCIADDKLFIHNTRLSAQIEPTDHEVNMIHAYSLPAFTPLFSFGSSYKSEFPMLIDRMTTGSISCNNETSTIVYAFDKIPMVHGYSTDDGSLKWKTKINDLNLSKVLVSDNDGRTTLTYQAVDENIMDMILSPVSLQNENMLMQIQRNYTSNENYEREESILSILFNSSNGEGELLEEELPIILNVTEDRLISISEDRLIVDVFQMNDNYEADSVFN